VRFFKIIEVLSGSFYCIQFTILLKRRCVPQNSTGSMQKLEKMYRVQFQRWESGQRGNWQRQWAHARHDNRLQQMMAAYNGGTPASVLEFLSEAKEHTIQIRRGGYP